MAKFVLTAQLELQAPRNAKKVVDDIQRQLNGVKVPIQVKGAKEAVRQVDQLTDATKRAGSAADALGRSFGLAIKRFAAFTVASRAVSLFTNNLASAVDSAIDFQREMVKISQVTGKSIKELKGLSDTISRLSAGLGTSSADLLSTARILSQAGVKAKDLQVALEALAKTTLAPTFDDITQTAEGAVAILAQFGEGVGALERQLGAINAVAGQFAVESEDLIGAVRRFGGVFKASGGSLEELLAVFTAVRATTRESAESIATGLRTIFVRIQRPKTIEFLRKFGVELTDLDGKFVGPYEAAKRLSEALSGLEQGDLRFIQIAEELGGFRQIGKVIPLLQQFATAQSALAVATEGSNSLTRDAETAQQALAVQITKVKEEFLALVRGIADSTSFQLFARTALEVASALIKVGEAIKPLIPLIGALAAFKFARGLGSFAASAGAAVRGLGKNQGGMIQAFARGGFVPGSGNRDTVPAMLTPGEFVIKKSSAAQLGADTLHAMNQNRYADGGRSRIRNASLKSNKAANTSTLKTVGDQPASFTVGFNVRENAVGGFILQPTKGEEGAYNYSGSEAFLIDPGGKSAIGNKGRSRLKGLIKRLALEAGYPRDKLDEVANTARIQGKLKPTIFPEFYPGVTEGRQNLEKNADYQNVARASSRTAIQAGIEKAQQLSIEKGLLDINPAFNSDEGLMSRVIGSALKDENMLSTIDGYIFESMIGALSGAIPAGGKTNFDFPRESIRGNKRKLKALFGNDARIDSLIKAEGKRSRGEFAKKDGVPRKLINDIQAGVLDAVTIERFAKGGGVGTDTVPALLTPGEFVVNKRAAQSIGYGNLNSMNKTGVARFAKGGSVQRFANGGAASGGGDVFGGFTSKLFFVTSAIGVAGTAVEKFGNTSLEASDTTAAWTIAGQRSVKAATSLAAIWLFLVPMVYKFFTGIKTGEKDLFAFTRKLKDATKVVDDSSKGAQGGSGGGAGGASGGGSAGGASGVGGKATSSADRIAAAEAEFQLRKKRKAQAGEAVERRAGIALNTKKAEGLSRDKKSADDELRRRTETTAELRGSRANTGQQLEQAEKKLDEETKALAAAIERREQAEIKLATATKDRDKQRDAAGGTRAKQQVVERIKARQQELLIAQKKGGRQIISAGDGTEKKIEVSQGKIARELALLSDQRKREEEVLRESKIELNKHNAAVKEAQREMEKAKKAVSDLGESVESASNEQKKAATANKQVVKQLEQSEKKLAGAKRNTDRINRDLTSVTNKLGSSTRSAAEADKALIRAHKRMGLATEQAAKAEKALARERRKAALQKAVGKAGQLGTVGLGAVASAAAIGQQVAGGVEDYLNRKTEQAIAAGNIDLAVDASGKAAVAEGIGRMFTVGGFLEAYLDPKGFAEGVKRKRETNEYNAAKEISDTRVQLATQTITQARQDSKQADIGSITSSVTEGIVRQRQEAADLTGTERDAAIRDAENSGRNFINTLADSGASLKEIEQAADGLAEAIGSPEYAESLDRLVASIKAERAAREQLNKANLDSLRITSAFGAAADASARFIASLQTGVDSLALYSDELEKNAARLGTDSTNAINQIEQQLLASAGGEDTALGRSIQGQAEVARRTNEFGLNVSKSLQNFPVSSTTTKDDVKDALISAIPNDVDEATRAKLLNVINQRVDSLEGDISQVDFSALAQDILSDGAKLSAGFREAAKLQSQHNATMTSLYQQREALEQKAAAALNQAIETQLEAAKIFEEFGGARLTEDQQLQARISQFNNIGGVGGLGAQLNTGSAADIRRVGLELGKTFADQSDQVMGAMFARSLGAEGVGPFAGLQGFAEDKRPEAQAANAALIQFTKQRIQLLKEELSIVQKKNAAEKSSLEALISGDVDAFLERQTAAAASAALATGKTGLTGLFSAGALGAGFKELGGQGLSDQQLRQAEGLTLERFGLQSRGVLSGTTAEEESIKAQGRELAGVLSELSQQEAAFAQAEIAINNATIRATQIVFDKTLEQVTRQNEAGGAAQLARGGMVYASRGIFVPRGTDTVPAMLTPGEFVVNRAAVQRGNNLQLLRAMNSGGGASSPGAMSGGGQVRYYQNGGIVDGISNIFSQALPQLTTVFSDFATTVDKLVNTKFQVALDPTNINVNFNGGSFLATLKDDLRKEILDEVGREIQTYKLNNSGDLVKKNVV